MYSFRFTRMQTGLRQEIIKWQVFLEPNPKWTKEGSLQRGNELQWTKEETIIQTKQRQATPHPSREKGGGLSQYETTFNGDRKVLFREKVYPRTAKCHNCGRVGNFQREMESIPLLYKLPLPNSHLPQQNHLSVIVVTFSFQVWRKVMHSVQW